MTRYGPRRHVRDVNWLRSRSIIDPITGCWVWQRTRNHRGYGLFNYATDQGILTGIAHRLALTLALGRPILPGLFACHRCDNPPCVNGEHLFEGTPMENTHDCLAKGRREPLRGEENGHAKLTRADLPAILAALADGSSQSSVARRFGVNQSQISRIKNGKAWI